MPFSDKQKQLEYVRNRLKQNVQIAREWLLGYLKIHPCIDCGETHLATLDFDHVREKKKVNISVLIRRGQTLRVILKEVEKCDVRCSNCHRKRTYKANGWMKAAP